MENLKLDVLRFLKQELEAKQTWSYLIDVQEKFGVSYAKQIIKYLIEEKLVTQCGCGCEGFMISPAGNDKITPPPHVWVWKTESGDVVRLTHMSDEHLRNAIIWLLTDSSLSDECEGISITAWLKAMSTELHSRFSI